MRFDFSTVHLQTHTLENIFLTFSQFNTKSIKGYKKSKGGHREVERDREVERGEGRTASKAAPMLSTALLVICFLNVPSPCQHSWKAISNVHF